MRMRKKVLSKFLCVFLLLACTSWGILFPIEKAEAALPPNSFEGFEAGNFAASYYTGGAEWNGDGTLTSDPSRVISGNYSAFGTSSPTIEWHNFLWSNGSKMRLEAGATYNVTFKEKVTQIPVYGGYFFFVARTNIGGISQDVGSNIWNDGTYENGTKSFTFTLRDYSDYFLMWGNRYGGAISIDDIQVTKVADRVEGFEAGNFAASYYTGGAEWNGDGILTSDPGRVISGNYSAFGTSSPTIEWHNFLWSNGSKIKLEAGATYNVTFKEKVTQIPVYGGYFFFVARTNTGGISQDVGFNIWNDGTYENGTKSFTFTLRDYSDYFLMWGNRYGGAISIDDIQVTKVADRVEGFEAGNFAASYYTGGAEWNGDGILTSDPSRVISGNYSAFGTSSPTIEWHNFLWSNGSKMKLEAGATYNVTFKEKVTQIPVYGGYFFFVARTNTGGISQDVGFNIWCDGTYENGTKSFTFTLKNYSDYFLMWGNRYGGAISIDDIQVTKLSI